MYNISNNIKLEIFYINIDLIIGAVYIQLMHGNAVGVYTSEMFIYLIMTLMTLMLTRKFPTIIYRIFYVFALRLQINKV